MFISLCFTLLPHKLFCQAGWQAGVPRGRNVREWAKRRGDFSPSCCAVELFAWREQWDVSCVPFCPCCWASLGGTPLSSADLPQIPLREWAKTFPDPALELSSLAVVSKPCFYLVSSQNGNDLLYRKHPQYMITSAAQQYKAGDV